MRGYPDSEPGTIVALDHESHLRDAIESGTGVFLPNLDSWLARYPASPPRPRAGVAGRRRDRGAADDRGVADAGGDRLPVRRATRDFDDGTRDLAIRLADQGAQALDRALAWDGDRRSREALERGQGRLALLVRASDVLGSGTDIGAGIAALPGLIVPALADWCAIELLDVDAPELEIGAAPEMRDAVQRLAACRAAQPRQLARAGERGRRADDPRAGRPGDDGARGGRGRRWPSWARSSCWPCRSPRAGGDPQGSIVLGAADAGRFGPDDQALVQDLAGRIARRRGALEPVRRGHPVQGHRRRQRRRRVHVRPRLAPPDLCQPRRGRPAGRRACRARRDERARAAAAPCRSGSSAPGSPTSRDAPSSTMTYSEVLARGRRPRVPGRGHPAGGDAARRDADGGPHRARHQRADRRPGAAGPDRRRRATTGGGAPRRHPVDGRRRPGRRRRRSGSRWPTRPRACCSARTLPRGWPTSSDVVGAMAVPGGQDGAAGTRRAAGAQTVQLEDGRWIEVSTYPAELGVSVGVGPRTSRIVVLRDVTPGPRRRGRARGVPGRPVARAADAGDDDLRLRQGPPAPVAARRPGGDAERHRGRGRPPVPDRRGPARAEPRRGRDHDRGRAASCSSTSIAPVVASEAARWGRVEFETRPAARPAGRVRGADLRRAGPAQPGLERRQVRDPGHDRRRSRPRTTADEVLVRVLDRGTGVSAEEAERLFELFYRSPQATRTASGAGIGLYVSRGLITAMGGRIWTRPRDGGGSEFGFSLPHYQEDLFPVASGSAGGSAG